MATPQTENGYTRIANELFDAILGYRCSNLQKEIIFAVIRYTYGFQRKEAELSVRFLGKYLGRSYQKVSESLKGLIERNVIQIEREFGCNQQSRVLKLNKNYDTWLIPHSPLKGEQFPEGEQFLNSIENSPPNGEQDSPPNGEQRNKNIKKTLKKYSADEFERLWSIFPNGELGNKGSKKNALKEFQKLDPNEVSLETLITAIERQASYKRACLKKGFAENFQHVERWLKNERWTDDIPETRQQQTLELRTIE